MKASGVQKKHCTGSPAGFRPHILSTNYSFLVAQRIFLIENEATVSVHLNTTTKMRITVDKVDLPCFYENAFGLTDMWLFLYKVTRNQL